MTQYEAYLGIDWADKKHDLCLLDARSKKRKQVLPHTPQANHRVLQQLGRVIRDNKLPWAFREPDGTTAHAAQSEVGRARITSSVPIPFHLSLILSPPRHCSAPCSSPVSFAASSGRDQYKLEGRLLVPVRP